MWPFDAPWSNWKFSSAISRVIQHPAIVPHHWLLSHSTIISPLWHLLLNRALKRHYAIIPSHTSLKLLVLLRIMSLFKGTLSFLIFVIHMIINMSIIPTSPSTFSSIWFISTFHSVGSQIYTGHQCKLHQPYNFHSLCWLSSSPICFYSSYEALFYTWLFQPKYSRMFCFRSQGKISEGWYSGIRTGHWLEGHDGGDYRSGEAFYPL